MVSGMLGVVALLQRFVASLDESSGGIGVEER